MHHTLEDSPPDLPAERRHDLLLEQKSFDSRTVLLFGTVSDVSAGEVVRRLVALDNASHEPITMLISSPGGHVESGDAIHNLVRFIESPVTMIGTGWVGSAATHVYLAVPTERRYCLPHTRFLIHQPSGGIGGPRRRHRRAGARDPAHPRAHRRRHRARERSAPRARARRHRA